MPNRILKDSILVSKKVGGLSDFQFRMWAYLIVYADDYGRAPADPELIKGQVYTRRKGVTEAQIKDGLTALANAGMIEIYEVDGDAYLCFPNWEDHQRIQAKRPKYPAPPESPCVTVSHGESPCVTVSDRESPPKSESEYESESNTRENAPAREGADRGVLKKYGSLQNVLLSEKEHADLLSRFSDAESRIELFGAKLAAKGYKYDNHYAAILLWYQQDKKETGASSFDVDEFFQAALENTYGGVSQ